MTEGACEDVMRLDAACEAIRQLSMFMLTRRAAALATLLVTRMLFIHGWMKIKAMTERLE